MRCLEIRATHNLLYSGNANRFSLFTLKCYDDLVLGTPFYYYCFFFNCSLFFNQDKSFWIVLNLPKTLLINLIVFFFTGEFKYKEAKQLFTGELTYNNMKRLPEVETWVS